MLSRVVNQSASYDTVILNDTFTVIGPSDLAETGQRYVVLFQFLGEYQCRSWLEKGMDIPDSDVGCMFKV